MKSRGVGLSQLLNEQNQQRVNPSRVHANRVQLDSPLGQTLLAFDRMRSTRHEVEYPPTDTPNLEAHGVTKICFIYTKSTLNPQAKSSTHLISRKWVSVPRIHVI